MKKLVLFLFAMLSPFLVNAYQYGSVTATTGATLVMAASRGRTGVVLCNDGTAKIYIGLDSSLTTANGLPIGGNSCYSASSPQETWKGTFYAITTTGTADVRYQEYGLGDVQ